MVKNRSRLDIIYDILKVARSDIRTTKLMYDTGITSNQLSSYMTVIGDRLIETYQKRNAKYYKTTPNGEKFIELMNELRNLMPANLKDF